MPTVSRTFTVAPAPQEVLDYLADFGNAPQWDPGTQSCTREDSGPVTVGSRWHNVSSILGVTTELTYTLREKAADHIVLVGENDSSTSTDTITVVPDGTGSQVTYTAQLQMHGAATLLSPAMKLVFEKLAHDTEKQMTAVLDTRAEPAGGATTLTD